ncbi:hypothetical protein GH733_013935 [Mirounga leonina]|nr:hypothetical protein GH733_013935 [Mirounga leonina]
MAVRKNKHFTKGSKKVAKKKVANPFSRIWHDVKAPAGFNIRNKNTRIKIAFDGLKGGVFEVSLADLQNDEVAFRKSKLITEDVRGKSCLTSKNSVDFTSDKMCSVHWKRHRKALPVCFSTPRCLCLKSEDAENPECVWGKLMGLHDEGGSYEKMTQDETGAEVERYEPPVQEAV